MKFSKEVRQTKILLGFVNLGLAFECAVLGFDLCRFVESGEGIHGIIFGAIGAVICFVCIFKNCKTISRYEVMNKEWEDIEK